jgi:hypothetical protein
MQALAIFWQDLLKGLNLKGVNLSLLCSPQQEEYDYGDEDEEEEDWEEESLVPDAQHVRGQLRPRSPTSLRQCAHPLLQLVLLELVYGHVDCSLTLVLPAATARHCFERVQSCAHETITFGVNTSIRSLQPSGFEAMERLLSAICGSWKRSMSAEVLKGGGVLPDSEGRLICRQGLCFFPSLGTVEGSCHCVIQLAVLS